MYCFSINKKKIARYMPFQVISRFDFFFIYLVIIDTPSVSNCSSFDFFNLNFDHLSYSKNLCKYNQI